MGVGPECVAHPSAWAEAGHAPTWPRRRGVKRGAAHAREAALFFFSFLSPLATRGARACAVSGGHACPFPTRVRHQGRLGWHRLGGRGGRPLPCSCDPISHLKSAAPSAFGALNFFIHSFFPRLSPQPVSPVQVRGKPEQPRAPPVSFAQTCAPPSSRSGGAIGQGWRPCAEAVLVVKERTAFSLFLAAARKGRRDSSGACSLNPDRTGHRRRRPCMHRPPPSRASHLNTSATSWWARRSRPRACTPRARAQTRQKKTCFHGAGVLTPPPSAPPTPTASPNTMFALKAPVSARGASVVAMAKVVKKAAAPKRASSGELSEKPAKLLTRPTRPWRERRPVVRGERPRPRLVHRRCPAAPFCPRAGA